MKPRRKFSKEFKRLIVEELTSQTSTLAQLSRMHPPFRSGDTILFKRLHRLSK
jgi:DNA invertase Pin-like site-specific DNA recombinase